MLIIFLASLIEINRPYKYSQIDHTSNKSDLHDKKELVIVSTHAYKGLVP